MKSELVDLKPTETELTYPCLREARKAGHVVLFTDKHSGTVVCGSVVWPLGYISQNWGAASDDFTWKTPEKGVLLTP